MSMFKDGAEMTHGEWFKFMREIEREGDRDFRCRGLVRVGDCLVTPETAAELEGIA